MHYYVCVHFCMRNVMAVLRHAQERMSHRVGKKTSIDFRIWQPNESISFFVPYAVWMPRLNTKKKTDPSRIDAWLRIWKTIFSILLSTVAVVGTCVLCCAVSVICINNSQYYLHRHHRSTNRVCDCCHYCCIITVEWIFEIKKWKDLCIFRNGVSLMVSFSTHSSAQLSATRTHIHMGTPKRSRYNHVYSFHIFYLLFIFFHAIKA